MKPPLIYNLFPRLVGATTGWGRHAARAREMGFNWLYLNPWHYPGFSGSLYAPKELRRMNPLFLPPESDELSLEPLRHFLGEMRAIDLPVMMDLVVNHTSKDSPLIQAHPYWFVRDGAGKVVSPFVVDPDDPSKKTVWGDLAEVDNADSADRDRLWSYWADLVRDSLEYGFSGFRCDAAYMVPVELWQKLIEVARSIDPGVRFFAETLGAPSEAVVALRRAGFDFIFNSSKWWDLRAPWALDQHEKFRDLAPSISFPETHDTTRLAADSGGNEAVQRQRYAFAAAFSAGLMMPIGYEFGFRKQVNVVETQPSDWEESAFDITDFVTRVNRLKRRHPLLQGEGVLREAGQPSGDVLLLERSQPGAGTGWVAVNRREDASAGLSIGSDPPTGLRLFRICREDAPPDGEPVPEHLTLRPAEVVYLLPELLG
ncbi:MAG: alpha-amylase [Gemmatimonadetes bacterium]|nr:alpha-amylase [Gemmatimonadota bacterium]